MYNVHVFLRISGDHLKQLLLNGLKILNTEYTDHGMITITVQASYYVVLYRMYNTVIREFPFAEYP